MGYPEPTGFFLTDTMWCNLLQSPRQGGLGGSARDKNKVICGNLWSINQNGKRFSCCPKHLLLALTCVRVISLSKNKTNKQKILHQTSQSVNVGRTNRAFLGGLCCHSFCILIQPTGDLIYRSQRKCTLKYVRTVMYQPLFNFGMLLLTWHNILLANKCLAFFSLD